MVKCKDCLNVKRKYIPAWEEYKYRCNVILTMQDMATEDADEDIECDCFKPKRGAKVEASRQ